MKLDNSQYVPWIQCTIDPDKSLTRYQLRKCAVVLGLSTYELRRILYHNAIPTLDIALFLAEYFHKSVEDCWIGLEVTV